MMRFAKCFFVAAALAVCVVAISAEVAECQNAVRIIFVKGSPKIASVDAEEWSDCVVGMDVKNGDRVRTLADEAVEISFAAGNPNVIRIGENSDVLVKKGESPYSIELLNGEVMTLLRKLPKRSTFEIRTPAGLSGARGTGWRSSTTGDRAMFEVFEASIYAKGIDRAGQVMTEELVVESGWKTVVDRFERPERLERLSAGDMERWNSWKDDARERLEKSAGQEGAATRGGGGVTQVEAQRPSGEEIIAPEQAAETAGPQGLDSGGLERSKEERLDAIEIETTEKTDDRKADLEDKKVPSETTGGEGSSSGGTSRGGRREDIGQ
jgi:hypothetical protein